MGTSNKARRVAGLIAIGFGALSLISGGTTLLGGLDMGRVVPVVLWFNTLAGMAYIAAGLALWRGRRWAFALSLTIFAATLLVFAIFGLHIAQGGAFEMRTVLAMTLRCAIWGMIACLAHQIRVTPPRG
ncbi:hypothetical protein [Celeribacter neptunius]|uniref:Uncharacterized protein n=1 Tax=Celeribacter neptunius TaxID=588602 RepID=A0A1I3R6C2_9RHOB|nr:hypothetical protein [Celeribacter neptunius]SFJ42143.1 hypothetical protein SAMN04487991_2107 [Celeribacter neptunius]